ncbi:putative SOS response-associated peptidase YedK [Azospirillum canadense]|nr:putative SOS response-associated peptidase YedK [Azospirillum canadense]
MQTLPVIRFNPETKERRLSPLRWGLVPVWAKDPSGAAKMINARAEGVADRPAFRSAFKKRRCLVPFDAYYEWRKVDGAKIPHAIATDSNGPDAFAGLWEGRKDPDSGEWLHTFTIITTEANDATRAIHDRMPVILPPDRWSAWLGEEEISPDALQAMLSPYPSTHMRVWQVSKDVGSVKNDRADLIDAVDSGPAINPA